MWYGIITLFPEMFQLLDFGIMGRAKQNHLIEIQTWNPRDFTKDTHKTVDGRPYGGGPGMIMMAAPLHAAIHTAKAAAPAKPLVIYLSPQGRAFNQSAAHTLSKQTSILFVAGRYEGVDERIINQEIDEEWSIGDYILSGGELGALVMMDAITRHLPGVLGEEQSLLEDTFSHGLLKYPQYTAPNDFNDEYVPEVLLSGHHANIKRYRLKQALGRTWLKRPDLLEKKQLSQEEFCLLAEFIKEFKEKI